MNSHRHTSLVAETDLAYTQFRLHLHDPWAGVCPTCDVPGPCALYIHLLDRLAAIEAAQLQHTDDEDPDPRPGSATTGEAAS
ncbi:hypothetical protein AB0I28_06585 [Phytomonospora sp. NPDC050363]|uniref:hypothetical protein n=1 Tax=Phytomonospora sp. NPDC050363 TaxID=3155642 RepID=UPI0033F398F8